MGGDVENQPGEGVPEEGLGGSEGLNEEGAVGEGIGPKDTECTERKRKRLRCAEHKRERASVEEKNGIVRGEEGSCVVSRPGDSLFSGKSIQLR